MRDLFKLLLIGLVVFLAPQVNAESYKVLVIPDNIVTESASLDSFIYNASAEFFADEVVNLLNGTDYISAPTVSETRNNLKKTPTGMIAAKNLTSRFRSSYNVDYQTLKKITSASDYRYALLITSYVDAENYILRRTLWDVLNIPGATVVDPAYKISTYAVLVDTQNNTKLWADTFYKTISVCENRIITRGISPQTEQLQKIKDYSRYLCPQIAQSIQTNILPEDILAKESKQIDYDMGNIDNVFTKKYRHINKEYDKIYAQRKSKIVEFFKNKKQQRLEKKQAEAMLKEELKVKATPVYETKEEEKTNFNIKEISFKKKHKNVPSESIKLQENVQEPIKIETNLNYYKDLNSIDSIEIKRTRKNRLIEPEDDDKPALRDYYQEK